MNVCRDTLGGYRKLGKKIFFYYRISGNKHKENITITLKKFLVNYLRFAN